MNNLSIYERIIDLRNKYQKGDYRYSELRLDVLNELLTIAFRNNDSLPTKLNLCIDTTLIEEVDNLTLEILRDLGYPDSFVSSQHTLKHSFMDTPVLFHFCCR